MTAPAPCPYCHATPCEWPAVHRLYRLLEVDLPAEPIAPEWLP